MWTREVEELKTVDRLSALMPGAVAEGICACGTRLTEVRLRAGRPAQLVGEGLNAFKGEAIDSERLKRILAALMDYSVYAREDELRQGFFTMRDGCRVGVCGTTTVSGDKILGMSSIGSACVRIAREIPGCADALVHHIAGGGPLKSLLLISPPGMGKTTCLRDIARQLSEQGHCVGVADERHEIAACHQGVPSADVGPRTDVLDGCPKWAAIGLMTRAMAPDVIVTDEIGEDRDAEALAEARRCGIAIVASAHADSFVDLMGRRCMRGMIEAGIFDAVACLGGHSGGILEIRDSSAIREARTA